MTMPLHPEAQQLLAALDAAGLPPFEHMTVPQAPWCRSRC
jgi:acetyl esterase